MFELRSAHEFDRLLAKCYLAKLSGDISGEIVAIELFESSIPKPSRHHFTVYVDGEVENRVNALFIDDDLPKCQCEQVYSTDYFGQLVSYFAAVAATRFAEIDAFVSNIINATFDKSFTNSLENIRWRMHCAGMKDHECEILLEYLKQIDVVCAIGFDGTRDDILEKLHEVCADVDSSHAIWLFGNPPSVAVAYFQDLPNHVKNPVLVVLNKDSNNVWKVAASFDVDAFRESFDEHDVLLGKKHEDDNVCGNMQTFASGVYMIP